ncbi:Semialdehyde dehydrogenase NAD-binding [Clostridium carboxidivorans P7]|uniref:Semialdehyde dehydrogenase NAD-binding n=1 Tax=Clostridium carboxidivorans P7 TaxID=536227 RepID=C6PZ67_9CLOT|nr:Semialdehyde dehydrogenase NAD-binding [Clostridium carboxidivorans P7]EFG87713.1 semialdehyde dehydrogenase, NAD binding domain protein [Clostridium carboxidivorans P7]
MNYNVAVVGCTGMVGRKFIEVLVERNFPVAEIYFFASAKSAGKVLKFKDKDVTVEELKEDNIKNKKIDFALFFCRGQRK